MRVSRCSISALVAVACACAPPTVGVGEVAQTDGQTSSGAAASTTDTTQPGGASTSVDASESGISSASGDGTSTGAGDEGGTTTSGMLEELPPMAAGEWLCTGFEDPIYIRLEEGDEMPWSGTACGPSVPLGDPSEYTNCDDLDFSHFNVTSTQAYWVFELPYEGLGMEPILFEFGVSYAADTDTLEGFLWADTTLEYQAETCTRQAG